MSKEHIKPEHLRKRPVFSTDNLFDLSAMRALVPDKGIERLLTKNTELLHRKAEGVDPTDDELKQHRLLMEELFIKLRKAESSRGRMYHSSEWRTHLRSMALFWQFDTNFNELRGEE